PKDGQTIWASVNNGGMFKSIDGGATWNESRQGFSHIGPAALEVNPSNPDQLFAGSIDPRSATLGRLGFSEDGGATWQDITTARDIRAIAFDPSNTARVLIGGSIGDFAQRDSLLLSTDGGNNFFAVLPPVTFRN